jgi:hypothetical protein
MSCPKFVAQSLAVRTAAHILHLTANSYARHVALADFYEALVDLVDRYAEIHMAEAGAVSYPSLVPPRGEAVSVLQDYLELVRVELAEDGSNKTKETILAEIEELTLRTLYKLKTFP